VNPTRLRPRLYRNPITYAGGLLTVLGLVLVLMGMLFQFTAPRVGPYAGIITFVAFPAVIVVGVLGIFGGMWHESLRRRRAHTAEAQPFPAVDLNEPRQRHIFTMVVVSGSALLAVLAVAGYNAFLLTESVGFCGNTCHTQMGPEMTAYQHSPHARVPCVSCHVGDGAGRYVASKLNGVRQLAGVVFGNYDKPIPTPVRGLRPARETCEECHWPAKSWGSQLYQRSHFRYDEKSTPEQISMLLKVGGGQGDFGTGIHWHMALQNEVTFASDDAHLQSIPWVRVKRPDGSVTEYTRTEKPVEPDTIAALPKHTMDCIDCHSRPAHQFETPDVAVDRALAAGAMPSTLPWVKSISVDTLSKAYKSRDAAHTEMRRSVAAFYADKYPDVAAARSAEVQKLADGLVAIYDRNVFPEMDVSWKTYPSNLGHRNSPGCFRCHDGKHVSQGGKVLPSACDTCHTEPQRGPPTAMGQVMARVEKDWHPWQTPEKHLAIAQHKEIQCYECHVSGRRPKTECSECHSH
jgi:hypothetical protein